MDVTTRIFIEFTFKYFYLNIKSLIGFWSEKNYFLQTVKLGLETTSIEFEMPFTTF